MNIGKALTWNELADLYDKDKSPGSNTARTLKMSTVFDWAKNQPDKFIVKKSTLTLHQIISEKKDNVFSQPVN